METAWRSGKPKMHERQAEYDEQLPCVCLYQSDQKNRFISQRGPSYRRRDRPNRGCSYPHGRKWQRGALVRYFIPGPGRYVKGRITQGAGWEGIGCCRCASGRKRSVRRMRNQSPRPQDPRGVFHGGFLSRASSAAPGLSWPARAARSIAGRWFAGRCYRCSRNKPRLASADSGRARGA
jgi:hypothetical protein